MPTPAALDPQLAAPLTAGLVAAGLFVGSIIRGWSSGKASKTAETKDAVVISGAFADAQPIRELVAAIKEQTEAAREQREATRDFDRSQSDRSRDLLEAMRDVKREAQLATEELKGIHEVVSRGVKIVPAGDPRA